MRSIIVQAGRDPGMAARLDTAMGLARAQGGHITLVVDTPIERFVTTDPFGGTYIAREALEAALEQDDALAAALSGRLVHEDVPFDVVQFEARQVDAMATVARLADLAVVSRSCGFAGELAVSARCPVLVLNDAGRLSLPLASACIAWDGGDEAALALRSAVPLLAGAGQVNLLTVASKLETGKPAGFPATDALRYLSRHGIKAQLHELERDGSVEETLSLAATQLGAELLVMGAYGHSRMREYLFGGVTRYFLDEAAGPPLLLAH